MLVLAADTSGKFGSIALAKCGPGEACEVLEIVPLEGGTFSAQLVPQIAALLSKHGFTKTDIGAFIVAAGPGSFTGLRVGLAAIKALAEVMQKPIASVSLLEVVALAAGKSGKVLAALDAGRKEAYAGEYQVEESNTTLISEKLLTQGELLQAAAGSVLVTPDHNLAELARGAGLAVEEIARPRSDAIARLGWRKLLAGDTVSPGALEANYIRRSDAEIFSKPNL